MVVDNINTMKTIFDLNFDLYQAVKQLDTFKYRREDVNSKSFSMTTCKRRKTEMSADTVVAKISI